MNPAEKCLRRGEREEEGTRAGRGKKHRLAVAAAEKKQHIYWFIHHSRYTHTHIYRMTIGTTTDHNNINGASVHLSKADLTVGPTSCLFPSLGLVTSAYHHSLLTLTHTHAHTL